VATWADTFRPIFDAGAGRNGWTADDADFPAPPDGIADDHLPAADAVFRALEERAPGQVDYLILGQDPYASIDPTGIEHATGVAFAIDGRCRKVPPSLRRILNHIPEHQRQQDLLDWRNHRRVLLLNASLTVRAVPRDDLPFWKGFVTRLVVQVKTASPDARLIAWGRPARDVICDALQRLGAFVSADHPAAHGANDFDAFWGTPVGQELASP
jgi:uracil DNA glycosylase